MNTYVITATYRFDVIHYLVRAESEEQAENTIEINFNGYDDDTCEDLKYLKEHYPSIIDLAIEDDELDTGSRYFRSDGNLYGFHVSCFDESALKILADTKEFKDYIYTNTDGHHVLAFCRERINEYQLLDENNFDTKEEADEITDKMLSILGPDYEKIFEKGRSFGWTIKKRIG